MNNIFDSHILIALLPYLLSLALSVVLGMFAWNRRRVVGAYEFAIFLWAQASMTLGFIFELLSTDIGEKVFWDDIQFLGMFVGPIAFYAFCRSYAGRQPANPRLAYALVSLPVAAFLLLIFTDSFHQLLRPSATLIPGDPFSSLTYQITPLFWLMVVYAYCFILAGLYVLAEQLVHSKGVYRRQVLTILIGPLVILVTSVLPVLGVINLHQRDITPLTFAISGLFIAFGLFRFQLLDVLPVAHQMIIQSLTDAVVVLDTYGRVIEMNQVAEKVSGKRLADVVGKPVDQVINLVPDITDILATETETFKEIEAPAIGARLTLDIRVSTLRDHFGRKRGQVILARDITYMKKSELELKQRTAQLEQANRKLEATNTRLNILSRAKDEFVSNVSHELRTPISNLKLYIDLLSIRPENQVSYLQTLARETNRLEGMIESLLMLSRLDQDRVSFRYQTVDLNDLVNEYVFDRNQLAVSKGLRLEQQISPDIPFVRADRTLIGQVLSILLTNALNYTPAGGVVTVFTHTRRTNGQVWAGVSVKDNGRGIPESEQKQLFTRFFRGSAAQEAEVAGTGLGLAISKEIITRHQGNIEVSSKGVPGLGTQFDVWLPAQFTLEEAYPE